MLHSVAPILIGLAVIALMTYRLSRWQPVSARKLAQMPVILFLLGAYSLASSVQHRATAQLGALDAGILAVELGVGLVVGWLIGRLTEIRTFPDGTKSHLTGVGIAVFLGFVAVRIGLGVLAAAMGASLASMPGAVLIVLAVIKGMQGYLVWQRVQRHHAMQQSQHQAQVSAETWR